ncbi:hypothetical protein VPH35_120488 [Triticum aestivum]
MDDDKYVHQMRQEMDKNMQREREVMDNNLKLKRATVDRMRKEEPVDQRLKHFHDDMDLKLKKERKDLDRTIQLERGKMEFNIMQARANRDLILRQERKDMDHKAKMDQICLEGNMMQDHVVQLECGNMDVNTMQARADMERKLQQDRSDLDYKAKMEDILMDGSMMQDLASTGTKEHFIMYLLFIKLSAGAIFVMQFIVHVDYELSHVPHAYHNGRPGMTTIVEPGKVDRQLMEKNLRCQGYKGKADLYYIKPGCVPPEGMVQISGQHDVDEIHIFCGYKDIGKRDMGEYGSSPKRKKLADNNSKKALDFGSSDEPLQ